MPTGGTAGQVLGKNSSTAYDTLWVAATNGTVTSVTSGNFSPLFNVSVATNTTTPAISYSALTASAKTVYGNPNLLSSLAPVFTSAPAFNAIANLSTNGFVKTGSSNGTLSVDTNTYALSTAAVPTGGTAGQVLTKNSSTNYDDSWTTSPVALFNSATASQTGFAADQYVTGSNVTYTAGSWAAGGVYHCVFEVSKTAAGTAAPVITIRAGTAGTTSDASVGTGTFNAGTAAVDDSTLEVWLTIRTLGASGTLSSVFKIVSSGGGMLGGTTTWNQIKSATSGTIDTTTATNIGVSFNGGASFSGTCRMVQADYHQ